MASTKSSTKLESGSNDQAIESTNIALEPQVHAPRTVHGVKVS
jgi:hypothetical protein